MKIFGKSCADLSKFEILAHAWHHDYDEFQCHLTFYHYNESPQETAQSVTTSHSDIAYTYIYSHISIQAKCFATIGKAKAAR